MMINVFSFLGIVSSLSILTLFFVLFKLSERFGSVVKMKPFYRQYYLALIFSGIGLLTHIFIVFASLQPETAPTIINSSWFLLVAYHLPLAIGVSIGLFVTWRYWSWLVTEK